MKKKQSAILVMVFMLTMAAQPPGMGSLQQWELFSMSENSKKLTQWIGNRALAILNGKKHEKLTIKAPSFYGRLGLFITIVRKGRVRGCFGAFNHENSSLERCLNSYIKGALFLDPRYKEIEPWELEESKIILTITDQPEEINSIKDVDISRQGVLINREGIGMSVVVPAEFRTEHALKQFLNKPESCRLYKFNAVTIK